MGPTKIHGLLGGQTSFTPWIRVIQPRIQLVVALSICRFLRLLPLMNQFHRVDLLWVELVVSRIMVTVIFESYRLYTCCILFGGLYSSWWSWVKPKIASQYLSWILYISFATKVTLVDSVPLPLAKLSDATTIGRMERRMDNAETSNDDGILVNCIMISEMLV